MYCIYFTIHTVLVSPAKARHQVKLPTHTPKSTQDKPKQVKPSRVFEFHSKLEHLSYCHWERCSSSSSNNHNNNNDDNCHSPR